jgi:predicted CXXCH cytochrome family protein
MKKTLLVVALTVALVLAFAATAYATSAKTWNYSTDYYTWGSTPGSGQAGVGTMLIDLGDNPTYPGAHAGYTANTAKCGLCHSVHRAKVGGVKLLNTSVATCAGCHKAGVATATDVLINWQSGGPHSSGTDASCTARSCHTNSPHGVNVSTYPIIAQKLLHVNTDAVLASALADPVASGITLADLNADPASTWNKELKSLVRTGYNCNQAGCHVQTLLAVVKTGWAEERYDTYDTDHGYVDKTGHLGQVGVNTVAAYNGAQRAFAPVASCVSCHDQTDTATAGRETISTVSGYTFPHSQTPRGTSNLGAARAYLWMGIAADSGAAKTGMTTTGMKAYDGACLKCHRSPTSGIGITY